MTNKKQIEIFSAGCPACQETIDLLTRIASPACEVTLQDMMDEITAQCARILGIHQVPAVIIDGKLIDRGSNSALNEQRLRAAIDKMN